MQKEDIKFENSTVLEGMTSIRSLLSAKEAGTNDRPILRILFDKSRMPKIAREVGYLRAMGEIYGFLPEGVSEAEISARTLGNSHGGIIAECGERTLLPLSKSLCEVETAGFYVMLQGIEDPYNFGYAIRSLYACGVSGIILPERNWMSAAGVVARASAGASEQIPIFVSDPEDAADAFHELGYTIACADERTDCLLHQTTLKKPLLLVVGGERRGISRALLEKADILVKIPYARPFAASLSAASAATILGYEILRQNQQ